MLGALAVLTAGAAHAELLEYTFKAPDGTQRSLTPNANTRYRHIPLRHNGFQTHYYCPAQTHNTPERNNEHLQSE
ncbi:TPA: DUF4165 domain-containing protein [Providencia stuartii]|uniref:DUF4165 domain-containing protein n=1 Tax=Providencia sp. 2.29 TaxID=2791982 RepID=UPI0034D3F0C9